MVNNDRVIAVIPARAGSKSIPDKNIRDLNGKPLISWAISSSKQCKYIDRTIVSTDGDKIANVANEFGAEVYTRPAELAQDNSLVIDCLRELITRLREEGETAKYLVLLEATSPLRTLEDIKKCIELVTTCDSVATFSEAELNPHRAWKKTEEGNMVPFIEGAIPWKPRQLLPAALQLNGAVYVFEIDKLPSDSIALLFGKIGAVEMPAERSIDIDNYHDLEKAKHMIGADSL